MQNTSVVTPIPDFDWDSLERSCPNFRKKLKKKNKESVIFSDVSDENKELYQALLDSAEKLVMPKANDIVKGTILSVKGRYAYIDVGWREPAIIDMNKESNQYLDKFYEGAELEIILKDVKLGTRDEVIEGSYTEVVKHLKYKEIFNSIGEPVAFAAHVKELIHGGYFLDIEGILVFMPGSLGGMNKLVNFETLLGKTIYVVPINYAKDKNYIVVSQSRSIKFTKYTEFCSSSNESFLAIS